MAPLKCCVGGCHATSATHRLYNLPRNDKLRSLWLSFLVPTNSLLLGLRKDQLLNRHVCHQHFERRHFDQVGRRLQNGYPSLFTEQEITRGEPLPAPGDAAYEHNYYQEQDDEDDIDETMLVITKTAPLHAGSALGHQGIVLYQKARMMNEHDYCRKQINEDETGNTLAATTTVLRSKPEVEIVIPRDEDSHLAPAITATGPSQPHQSTTPAKVLKSKPEVKIVIPRDEDSHLAPAITAAGPSQPHQSTTPAKESSLKKYGSKQRQFMKNIKKIATESLGLSSSERLAQAESHIIDKKLFENFHHLTKQAQTLLILQLRECRKNKMARRFTLQEKIMALLLMKQSPKEYKLLENMFALPSKRTLHRLSEKISVKPGINPQIFSFIANMIKNWDNKEKLCTIVFDEVSLTPHLNFDEKEDQVNGVVDIEERKKKICDHALVFMLRGICSSWRQTIAYYFTEGAVAAPELENILKKIVSQVAQTGLNPLGLVCDQGTTFKTTFKKLREDTLRFRNVNGLRDDGSVNISGHDLSFFFDSPHLVKGMRNNFLTKNIIWKGKKACWSDIQFIFDIDSKLGHTRALPKLTENHVNPKKIKKMKVSLATQVLSARTAAMLKYTNALNEHHTGSSGTMGTTAEVVEFLDKVFDSVNGHAGGAVGGKLRKAVKPDSGHIEFWMDAIKIFKNMKFEDFSSKVALQSGKARLVRVPTLEGWITTLESFVRLTRLLFQKYGVDYFYPRNINQDPLENFFGRIRALNYRNTSPDAHTFMTAFKSLLLTNILSPHSKQANCEADNGESIINDVGFLFDEKYANKENESPNIGSPLSLSQERPAQSSGSISREEAFMEKVKVQCSAYTAGYICRKLTKNIKCKSCLNTYTSSSVEGIHAYIQHREYKNLKNDNLVYPSEKVIRQYREFSQYVHCYLDKNFYKLNVLKNIKKNILKNFSLSWLGCAYHKKNMQNLFVQYIIKLQVHNWCHTINKILKGSIESKYVSKIEDVPQMALRKHQALCVRKKIHK